MQARWLRVALATVAVCVTLVAGVAVWWAFEGPAMPGKPGSRATRPDANTARDAPSASRRSTETGTLAERDPPVEPDANAAAWSVVDLDALRAELPDNLYWKMAVPTRDPAVQREREEERERWNVEYGKVLSNTATAEEVDAYYAHRHKLSSDYIEFATYLLADYGDDLPARDVALLKLAIELHMARLEEIPRQIVEAHERREAHEAARRAWLEQQEAFAGNRDGPP